MALDVDGLAVLGAIAKTPDAFPDLRGELAKVGRSLVVKQLKAKGLALDGLRRVRDCLGPETFALVVDGLTDAEAKGLVTRLDKYHPDLKTATPDWPRRHLAALGGGAEPAGKAAAKAPKAKALPPAEPTEMAPTVTRALGSPAFAASWDGKDHDAQPEDSVSRPKNGKAAKPGKTSKPGKSKIKP